MKDGLLGAIAVISVLFVIGLGYIHLQHNKAIEKIDTVIKNDSVIVYKVDTVIYKLDKLETIVDTIQN